MEMQQQQHQGHNLNRYATEIRQGPVAQMLCNGFPQRLHYGLPSQSTENVSQRSPRTIPQQQVVPQKWGEDTGSSHLELMDSRKHRPSRLLIGSLPVNPSTSEDPSAQDHVATRRAMAVRQTQRQILKARYQAQQPESAQLASSDSDHRFGQPRADQLLDWRNNKQSKDTLHEAKHEPEVLIFRSTTTEDTAAGSSVQSCLLNQVDFRRRRNKS